MMNDKKKELTPIEDNNTESSKKDSISKTDTSPVGAELLKTLTPEAKEKIHGFGMSMHRFGPMPNPLTEKINEQHIDKILEIAEKDEDRSFKNAGENRKFTLIYVLVFAALFVFSTIFLIVSGNKELYSEAVKLFVAFFGGLGGGFGIKSYMDRNK